MSLKPLIRESAPISRITDHLDALDHAGRMQALYALQRADLNALYALAADAPPLTRDHFLPPGGGAAAPHRGWNSVPVPSPWRRFSKVVAAGEDGGLIGYNDYRSGWWMGPGYFKLLPTDHEPTWAERGAWVVDYLQVPDGAVPDGWPPVVPNERGPQRLVYAGTRDFMRRVSEHVSVGRPFKGDDPLPFCFVVCREDGA